MAFAFGDLRGALFSVNKSTNLADVTEYDPSFTFQENEFHAPSQFVVSTQTPYVQLPAIVIS